MGINFLLKKEGLENIKKLDTMHINKIASNISEELCKSFPDLHLSQSNLFIQISRLDMYTAKMPDNVTSAKYVYGNNSIYFNENLDLNQMDIPAIHECIHYIQEFKDQKGKLSKLGLYNLQTQTGLAINEAAVQLVATKTHNIDTDSVTYYGMTFSTESTEYYPLECALLNQMMFFSGKESLYFSTLYSTEMFENAFSNCSSNDTYYEIVMAFDKLLNLETELSALTQKLEREDTSQNMSILLNFQIESKKKSIQHLVLKIQNKIIENCFKKLFTKLETFDDIREFEAQLDDFKKVLIITPYYNFYEEFCQKIQQDIAFKKDQIIKYGKIIDIPKEYSPYLPVVSTANKFSKLQQLFQMIKEFIFGNEIN